MAQRRRISATIQSKSYSYLKGLVRSGRAANVGDALDQTVELSRRLRARAKLERDTAAYFANMTPDEAVEENALAGALSAASLEIDVDRP